MSSYKNLISALLAKNARYDGRRLMEYRPITLELNPIPHANGSARVKIGKTEVLVGVKFDVDAPFPDTPDEGVLITNAELCPIASPEFEPGPPTPAAVELARVVDRGIRESGSLDFGQLCIKPKEKVWIIFIDIYPVNDEGNLFDAASLGAVAALSTARFPKYDSTNNCVLYKELTDQKLKLKDFPILTTFAKLGDFIFLDPDKKEEQAMDARLSISTLSDGTLTAMQKGGDGTFSKEEVLGLLELAKEKSKELREIIKKALEDSKEERK
ncbi:MAG: exosome complex protein Rrp42 [Candidatus Nanoarchaeia archaeon]